MRIKINFTTYNLFDGNLSLDETTTPFHWKLVIPSNRSLPSGTYNVLCEIYDVATGEIIASDPGIGALVVSKAKTSSSGGGSGSKSIGSIMQQMNAVLKLMSMMGGMKQGIHPTTNDNSSTHNKDREEQERKQDPQVKGDKKASEKKKDNASPKPPKQDTTATGGTKYEGPENWTPPGTNVSPEAGGTDINPPYTPEDNISDALDAQNDLQNEMKDINPEHGADSVPV